MPLDLEPLELEPVGGKLDLEPLDLEPVAPTSNKAADFARRIPSGVQSGTGRTIAGAVRAADILATPQFIPFMGGVPSSGAETINRLNQQMPAAREEYGRGRPQRLAESTTYQLGREIEREAPETFGVDRARDDEFLAQLATAGGEMVPTLLSGAVAGPAGVMLQYGGSAGESQAQEAIAAGREDVADVAFLTAAGLGGITEAALGVPGRLLAIANRARKAGVHPTSFGRWANRNPVKSGILKAGVEGGVREGGQEGLEQVGGNLIASDVAGYDPNRPAGQGVGRAMALGAAMGAGFGGGAAGLNQVQRNQQAAALRAARTIQTPDGRTLVVNPATGGTEFGPLAVDELPAPLSPATPPTTAAPAATAEAATPGLSLKPIELPDVPGVPTPLEGQPYEKAVESRETSNVQLPTSKAVGAGSPRTLAILRRSDFKSEEDWFRAVAATEEWANDPSQFSSKASPSLYAPWTGVLQVVRVPTGGFAVEYAGQRVGYGDTEEAAIQAAEATHRNFHKAPLQLSPAPESAATTAPRTGSPSREKIGTRPGEFTSPVQPEKTEAPTAAKGAEVQVRIGNLSIPVSPEQWADMATLTEQQQLAKYGTSRSRLMEQAAVSQYSKPKPNSPRPPAGPETTASAAGKLVHAKGFTTSEIGPLRKLAGAFLRRLRGQSFPNEDTGIPILVDRTGEREAVSGQRRPEELHVLSALPEMVRRARHERAYPDREHRKDIKAWHHYKVQVEYGGRTEDVTLVVRELSDGRRFYDSYILESKRPDAKSGTAPRGALGGPQAAGPSEVATPAPEVKPAEVRPAEPQETPQPPAQAPPAMQAGMDNLRFTSDPVKAKRGPNYYTAHAKDAKAKLIAELEKAVAQSPFENQQEIDRLSTVLDNPPEIAFKSVNNQNMGEGFEAKYRAEFDRAKQLLARFGKRLKPVTIEIPGDGTFTVVNTREALGDVLASAKRLQTATSSKWEGPSTPTPRVRDLSSKLEEDAERVYGARRAIGKLREQADNVELELEPELREQLRSAATNMEARLPENVAREALVVIDEQLGGVRETVAEKKAELQSHKTALKQLEAGELKPRRGKSLAQEMGNQQRAIEDAKHGLSMASSRLKELEQRRAKTAEELAAALALVTQPTLVQRLDSAIESLKTDPTKLQEGVTGLPVWLTREALRGALIVVRQAVKAGQSFAQAVQAGVAWLQEQNLAGFNSSEAQGTLEQAFLDEPGVREHVGNRLLQEDFSPAAKAAVEKLLLHEVKPDEQLFAEAQAVVEAVGPREALASYFGNPWGLPQDSHVVLGFALGNALSTLEAQARAAGDVATANRIGQENADFQSQFVQQSTETARTLRAYRYFDLVGNLSPFTADVFARKTIERASAEERGRLKPTLDGVGTELDKVNQQAIEETVRLPEVQGTARTAINQAIEEAARTPGTPLQQAITAEVIAQLQRSGKLTAVEAEIVRTHFAGSDPATTLAQKLERAQVPKPQQRAKQIEAEYVQDVHSLRAGLRKRLERARDGKIDAATLDAVDRAIRVRLRQMQVRLGALVRQHWTQRERIGQRLAESLVKEAGLTESAAEKLSAAIQRRFQQLATAKKEAVLRQLTKTPAARTLQQKSVVDRIIEHSNLGAFDSESLWNAVAEKLNLPSYSREASAEVKRLAERAQQLPEGSTQRQESTARLLRFIARQHGVKLSDVGWAIWYANTLSGPLTHLVNLTSNTQSLLLNTVTQMRDLRGVPQMLAATAKGLRTGLQEGRAIFRSGPSANRTKFNEQGVALEQLEPGDFTGAGLVRHWRFIARALAAADAAFYFPAREQKAITLARALAKQEGKTGAAIRDRAQQILEGTEQQQNEWGAQVDRERAQLVAMGEKPDALWTTRRLEQLREQAWAGDIGERADDYALRVTYNNQPYGLLGLAADVFKVAQRKVPGFRLVVPFVNIVANVTNDSLNYTPWGLARAAAASRTGVPSVWSLWSESARNGQTPLTSDAIADLQAKAFVGTVLFGAILARAFAGLDDEEGFQLYGKGPEDAAARKALRETGWIPYSVKLGGRYYSIANTPLAIPLGAAGNYLDALRWDKRFQQADAFNRFAVALWQVPHVITQQSFLDSAARLAGWVENPQGRSDQMGDRMLAEALRSGGSLVIPNAVRQLDRLTDPTLYDAKGIEGALVASIPFARRNGDPAINAFGEPITTNPWQRFSSDAKDNVWRDLAQRRVFPSLPDKVKNAQGREMTDAEHYRYVQESGAAVKRRLDTPGMRRQIQTAKEADLRKTITGIVKDEREKVRGRLGF